MSPHIVKEKTDDRIILVDSEEDNILTGLLIIGIGLFFFSYFFFIIVDSDYESQDIFTRLIFILLLLLGVYLLFAGLYTLIIRETIIVDKRFQTAIVMKKFSLTHFKFIKKIPFTDLEAVEITRNTPEPCYGSPANDSSDSWNVSLMTFVDGSVKVCRSHSKSKAEEIAESICKITGKMITHRTRYFSWDCESYGE